MRVAIISLYVNKLDATAVLHIQATSGILTNGIPIFQISLPTL